MTTRRSRRVVTVKNWQSEFAEQPNSCELMLDFRVNLDSYRGPIELLLFLIRKHEVDVFDIPINMIAEQYQSYLEIIEQLDINTVGDFLEMATLMMEIKAKMLLPSDDDLESEEQSIDDPREDLVQRLLEYKKFKDAACELDELGRTRRQMYSRVADDLPTRKVNVADQPIRDLEMWDLVSAFGRILREVAPPSEANIVYDDTPIHVYMSQIHEKLAARQRVSFSQMFEIGMHKSAMIGVFLAILELVRHHSVRAEQSENQNDILITQGENFESETEFAENDEYDSNS